MTKQILITGGRSFLGSSIYNRLKELKDIYHHDLEVYRTSSCSIPGFWRMDAQVPFTIEDTMSSLEPDIIFHCAGYSRNSNDRFQDSFITENVLGTWYLLDNCKKGAKIIFASSASVYGDCYGKDDIKSEKSSTRPTSAYSVSKLSAEMLFPLFPDIKYHILRYGAIIGKGSRHGAIPDIIKKIKSDSPILELFGDCPGSTKPYIHIDDAVSAAIYFANHVSEGVTNISTYNSLDIETVADFAMAYMKIKKQKKWLGNEVNFKGDNKEVYISSLAAWIKGFQMKYPHVESAVVQAILDINKQEKYSDE